MARAAASGRCGIDGASPAVSVTATATWIVSEAPEGSAAAAVTV